MSKIVLPTLAATCVALYFIRKRKAEVEVDVEPVDEMSAMDSNIADLAVAAD